MSQTCPMRESLIVIACILLAVPATLAAAAGTERMTLAISNDGRPVAAAIRLLSDRYGYAITYEDPFYVYAGDLQDVTLQVRKDLSNYSDPSKAPRVIVPRGAAFTVTYDIDAATRRPTSARAVMESVLRAQAATGIGGTFRLEQSGDLLHVLPKTARNFNGEVVKQSSILDAVITMTDEERSAAEALDAFCEAVTAATHVGVRTGMYPLNLFHRQQRMRTGASNEKARDVLTRLLADMPLRVTWAIYNAPPEGGYLLHIASVSDRSTP